MTPDQFYYLYEIRKEIEFEYKGKQYSITYGKEDDGREYICFGQRYEGTKFYSYGQFINEAKVENSYLKNFIEDL